jgi:hypothetical protein
MSKSNKEIAEIKFDKYEKKNVDFKDEHYNFRYGSWVQDAYIAGYLQGLKESKRLQKLRKLKVKI